MRRVNDILYHPRLSQQSLLNYYLNMLDDIMDMFRLKQIDVSIDVLKLNELSTPEHSPISDIISNCTLSYKGVDCGFDSFVDQSLSEFNSNELYAILAQLDLSSIASYNEDAKSSLCLLAYSFVRKALLERR